MVLIPTQALRIGIADVNRLTTSAVKELRAVRLAAGASAQRLIAQNELVLHVQLRRRQEEPFALAHVRGILASQAVLALDALAALSFEHLRRLQCFHGGKDVR